MQKKFSIISFLLINLMINNFLLAQERKTIAERLGYAKDARLLIILHADDLGVTHSENSATYLPWKKGH